MKKLWLRWVYRHYDDNVCCCGCDIGTGGSICHHGGCRSKKEYAISTHRFTMSKKFKILAAIIGVAVYAWYLIRFTDLNATCTDDYDYEYIGKEIQDEEPCPIEPPLRK